MSHLAALKAQLGQSQPTERWTTGYAALDHALEGGLVRHALNEIHVAGAGSGAIEALLPALGRLGTRLLAWIHPTETPYPPALAHCGQDLRRWIIIRPPSEDEHQWAIDQALRSGACDLVLAFVGDLEDRKMRRLQLAAEAGKALGLFIRPQALVPRPSPAALRLSASPLPSKDPTRRRVRFQILRGRGLSAAPTIDIEWSHEPLDGHRLQNRS